MRALLWAFCALLLCLVCAPAAGQVDLLSPSASGEGVAADVVFGFDGTLSAERWNPVSVTIRSPQSFSGAVVIEYDQDATQTARVMAPVSVIANTPVTAQVLICPPQGLFLIKMRLIDQNRGVVLERAWGDDPMGGPMPDVRPEPAQRLLAIGTTGPEAGLNLFAPDDPSLDAENDQWSRRVRIQEGEFSSLRAVSPGAGAPLPTSWVGFDGFTAATVRTSELRRMTPRNAAALGEWVRGGGRLILLAAEPGAEFGAWLELMGVDRAPVVFGEPVRIDPGSAKPEWAEEEWRSIAAVRPVSLTGAGERDGWRLDFLSDDGALAATGPAGFGQLVVCGFDPAQLPDGGPGASGELWTYLTRGSPPVEIDEDEAGNNFWWGTPSSGAGGPQRASIEAASDLAITEQTLSHALFLTLAGATGLLVLLVGPIDMLALKKLGARQRSWITASCWIALATGAGVIGPTLVRSAPTALGRVGVVDVLCSEVNGSYVSAQSWRSVVSGVFTGERGRVQLAGLSPSAQAPGPVAVRGVSPSNNRGYESGRLLEIDSFQSQGGVWPGELPAGTWMLRFLHEQGPTDLRLLVNPQPDGSFVVSGLPGVVSATASDRNSWRRALRVEPGPEGAVTLVPGGNILQAREGNGFGELPGSEARGITQSRRMTGDWTLLELRCDAPEPTASIDPESPVGAGAAHHGVTVYRVLIPHAPEAQP